VARRRRAGDERPSQCRKFGGTNCLSQVDSLDVGGIEAKEGLVPGLHPGGASGRLREECIQGLFCHDEQPAELRMLSRCANPPCLSRFLQLGTGRLFLVETESPVGQKDAIRQRSLGARAKFRCVERYWLCDECAKIWTLIQDDEGGISLTPLRRGPVQVEAVIPQVIRIA
jgi:hypothetical protein